MLCFWGREPQGLELKIWKENVLEACGMLLWHVPFNMFETGRETGLKAEL